MKQNLRFALAILVVAAPIIVGAGRCNAAWHAFVDADGKILQWGPDSSWPPTTNGQAVVTMTDSQALAVGNYWPACLWSNATLWVQTSSSNSVITVTRDPLLVQEEQFLINAAQQVSITRTDSPTQMNAKWTAVIAAATNNAQVVALVRQEAKFWAFLNTLTLNASGSATTNATIAIPIWIQIP